MVTGGHRERPTDVFFDGSGWSSSPASATRTAPLTAPGCTHSSVLAARLAHGDEPLEAARAARELASRAVAQGLREVGAGAGPVDILGIASKPQRLGRFSPFRDAREPARV